MLELKAEAARLLSDATGKPVSPESLGPAPKPEMGFFASRVAFELGGNPAEKAKEVAGKIKSPLFTAKAIGPYVNFFPSEDYSKQLVEKILSEKNNYGKGKQAESVMVEYSEPNTHKAFHIGHLRNTALGIALSNILEHAGHKVIRVNYINDLGLHVAKTLWALQKFHAGEEPPENKGKWLGEIYAEASKKLRENPEGDKEVRELLQKMDSGDAEAIKLMNETREWSLDEFKKIYEELGADFDKWYYESDIKGETKEIVKELIGKGVAKVDDGAVIVDNSPAGVNLLQRSDGTTLYSTSDLALAKHKFGDYDPDRSVYVVGSEQKFHFQMLFETLKKWGFRQGEKCFHLAYELVVLKSGKMKSREGEVILYEDFSKEAKERALKEVQEKNPDLEDKEGVARAVGIGAIKYSMLKVSNTKTIVFDWEKSLSFEGETAPYIQYANVRCHSILDKAGKKGKPGVVGAPELVYELSRFDEVVAEAAKEYSPHVLALYAYSLADAFSGFYTKQQVIGSKDEAALLALVGAASVVLENTLRLLGIEAPRRM
ncbi:MAG: arginine--tRNA ligase [Candidatus Diapherotrites archaeon]|nr:arginine--tRNA ligase [Candidatus Diapherotrites archaeon]